MQTLHLYLRRSLVEEVALSILPGDPGLLELLPRFGETDTLSRGLCLRCGTHCGMILRRLPMSIISVARSPPASPRALHVIFGPPRSFGIGRSYLSKAIDYMQANLEKSIDLPEIAAAAASVPAISHASFVNHRCPAAPVSHAPPNRPSQTSAAGNQHTNCRHRARLWIRDQEHLSRIFSRACGIAPAAFRRALRH